MSSKTPPGIEPCGTGSSLSKQIRRLSRGLVLHDVMLVGQDGFRRWATGSSSSLQLPSRMSSPILRRQLDTVCILADELLNGGTVGLELLPRCLEPGELAAKISNLSRISHQPEHKHSLHVGERERDGGFCVYR